ncbi:MAG TPA: DNA-binding protein [Isosphaeraceae bacterium]|nr:DNA-binding protein [Isosphaeraceae bacterium]
MAQFYTLEEAARVLGMNPEELKGKAQHREVRAFMDSGSWRFRVADIDELARRRGMGSDPDLSLSDLDLVTQPESGSEAELNLSEYQLGVATPDLGPPSMHIPASMSEADVQFDDLNLPPPPMTSSSSTIIGMAPSGKLPSDSDVRLVPDNVKAASDSDVRIKQTQEHRPSDSDVTLVSDDDEGQVPGSSDTFPVASGDTAIRQSPLLGSSAEVQVTSSGASSMDEEDSDFELTPSSVIDALQPESGSDFELTALDGSDEFESTPLHGPSDSDVTAAEPAASGINLGKPSDSGINLQGVGGFNLKQADSIELQPLEEDEAHQQRPPKKPAPPTSQPKPSPAATPLPQPKAKGEKDIFEDTDFEVDALDTDQHDQTVQLEAGSDYDLEEDSSDSGSEVFAVDEDEVDQNAATAMASGIAEEDLEEDFDAEGEGAEAPSAWDVEAEPAESASARASASPVLASSAASAEWGGIWVGVLGVATVFVLLLSFVSMDLVRNMYEFRGDLPVASGLVKGLSDLFGGK